MSASNGLIQAGYTSSSQDSRSQESSRGFDINSERSLIGIPPAEPDEHDRGLFFFFDSWTGQPSQSSASEESEYTVPEESSKASPPDHSASLPPAMTPQSDLDLQRMEDSQSRLKGSRASSASGYDVPDTPSGSGSASLGTNQAHSSQLLLQTQSGSWTSDIRTPTPLSPSPNRTNSDLIDPLEGINNPRDTIIINQEDLDFLQLLKAWEVQGQPNNSDDGLSPLHYPGRNSRQDAPNESKLLEGTKKKKKKKSHHLRSYPSDLVVRHKDDPKAQVGKKERRPLTDEERKRARALREIGVCLRCLFNHETCGLGDVCPRCRALKKPRIWMLACVRMRLGEAELHRTGALSFPEGLPVIDTWTSVINVPVSLYNIGTVDRSPTPESRPRLQIVCREHTPIPGVRSSKSWTKGADKIDIPLPTYAMTGFQLRETAKKMDELVDRQYATLVAELGIDQDEIVARTLSEAVRKADKCSTLKNALRISVMSRLASKSFNIYGAITLGIQQEQDPDCPYYNRIPIPPLLDAQLDSLWMTKMAVLRKKVLTELRAMIAQRGRKHWLMIFLTILVLLFNLEFLYQNQNEQTNHYQERTFRQRSMLESWERSAKILMAHFHTICHGNIPLSVDWNEEVRNAAEVDEQSLDFLTRLKGLVRSREGELSVRAKGVAGDPLVWISALFLPHEGE
ncbi:MAG: hypothetical protein ALECFALPRED_004053 [Alectoria fallacina]|uniref:Uncharacterized protein n=1 Tax=Alectoria fallacina TaxID=1903189 RepID=A0A8H3FW12_9LECA|nr:MAG: hypothetical protein ALECFALPRED_004053 [Alectoria fallacina]